jgi:hypothetical protein
MREQGKHQFVAHRTGPHIRRWQNVALSELNRGRTTDS